MGGETWFGMAFLGVGAPGADTAVVRAGTGYSYLSFRVWPLADAVGVEVTDFRLLDAMTEQTDLFVWLGGNDVSDRMFGDIRDDYTLRYTLDGFDEALERLTNCVGSI